MWVHMRLTPTRVLHLTPQVRGDTRLQQSAAGGRERQRLELLHLRDSSILRREVVDVPRGKRIRQHVRQRH